MKLEIEWQVRLNMLQQLSLPILFAVTEILRATSIREGLTPEQLGSQAAVGCNSIMTRKLKDNYENQFVP